MTLPINSLITACRARHVGLTACFATALLQLALTQTALAQDSATAVTPETVDNAVGSLAATTHSFAIHFPIALAIVASLCESLAIASKDRLWTEIGFRCLLFGATGAIFSAIVGLVAATQIFPTAQSSLLDEHRIYGLLTTGLYIIAVFFAARERKTPGDNFISPYRITIFATALSAIIAGYWGGKLAHW